MPQPVDRELLEQLVRACIFAADDAAMQTLSMGGVMSSVTRAAVIAAIHCLVYNGMVTVTPPDTWPVLTVLPGQTGS